MGTDAAKCSPEDSIFHYWPLAATDTSWLWEEVGFSLLCLFWVGFVWLLVGWWCVWFCLWLFFGLFVGFCLSLPNVTFRTTSCLDFFAWRTELAALSFSYHKIFSFQANWRFYS